MSVVNIPTSASGYHQSIVSQAVSAQRVVNKMQMSPKLNPKGFIQPLGRITNSASEFQKSMDASAARVFAFGAAVGVINGISNAFADMVRSAVEVEKSLKDIQVVMEATNREMAKFGQGLFDVAKNTATSFETVSKSAVELARQGLGASETLDRVNSALILSRLSGLDAVKSTETLTAAINSFNKEGITHEQIVNRMANVDAAFAVSSKDLAEAISRAGAVAQSSGVSFNELASIVTAVQQRTARGGSVIGNGFKSIFTRIKRSGVREALNAIGVATDDTNGNFRSGISILKDYAKVYKTLSDSQKAYTSEQIAGVFQIQNLQALIQDLGDETSIYERALSTANNTTNEAISRNAELNKTLSAIFNQTSLSVKELGARLAELAVTDSFKTLLNSVTKFAEWMTKLLDEDSGSDFAKNIVKGFGRFLSGPGAILIGAAFIKIFVLVTKFAKEAFADIIGINKEAKRQQTLQAAIGSILSSNSNVYQKILAASGNTAKQEQIILNIVKQETAERLKQESLIKRMAASSALAGVGAGERGFVPMGKRGSQKIGRKTLGMAQGFLPAINRENRAIRNRVGGARRGDRPVVLRNHSMGKGRRQNVVAHTGEWKVPNFKGSGGTAIFNRSMVRKYGLPRGARKITAADGFVPNFSKGTSTRMEKAKASELGWKAGGASPISKFSDSIDTFVGMINIARISKGAKEIGNKAHSIIAGKRSSVNNPEVPFGNNSIFDKEIGTGKNAGKERYIINPKFKNMSGVRQKFLKNGIHSNLLKDGNGKGTLTSIESLTKKWIDPKNQKDASWRDGQFQNIVGGVKGVWTESEAKRYIKKRRSDFGLKGKDIPRSLSGNKFFDLLAGKQYFEVKGKRRENPLKILKKAASLYLSNPKVNHKNNIPEKIDLGASKLFEKGINLIMARDTKLSRETINAAGGLSPTFKVNRGGVEVDTGVGIGKNQLFQLKTYADRGLNSKDKTFKFTKDDLIEGGGKNRFDEYIGGGTGTVPSNHLKDVYGKNLSSHELINRQQSDEKAVVRKRNIPTIDARAIATMIIPNEGYRRQHNGIYGRKIKDGKKTSTEQTRLKWNIEGIKRAGVEVSTEERIRKQAEKIYPAFVNRTARQLVGPQLAPGLKPSESTGEARKHTSVLAGHVFESALKSISKNTKFTHDSANFDIVGEPGGELKKLFGYNTQNADAKVGDTKDTKASFAQKIFKLNSYKPSGIALKKHKAQMDANEKAGFKINKGSGEAYGWKAAEGRINRLKKLHPGYKPQNASEGFIPNMSEGFIPNFAGRKPKIRGGKNKAAYAASKKASKLTPEEEARNAQINRWLRERNISKNSPEGRAYKDNGGRMYYSHMADITSGGLPFSGASNPSAKFRVHPTALDPVSKFASNKINNVTKIGRVGLGMGSIANAEARGNSQKIAGLEARITALESKVSSKNDPWAAAYKEDSRYNYNGASGYIPNYAEGWGWVQEILDKEVREQSAVGNKWKNLMVGGDKVQDQDKYRVSVDNKTGKVSYIDNKNSAIDPVGSSRGRRAILNNDDIQKTILNKFNSRLVEIQSYNEGGGKMLRNFGSKIFGKDLVERLTIDPQKQQQKELFNRFIERVRSSGVQNNPGLHIGTGGRSIMNLADNPVVQLRASGLRSILEGKGADGKGIPSGVKNSMVMDDFIRGMMMSSVSQGPNAGATSMKRLSGMSGLLGGLSKLGIGQLGERFFRLADWGKSAFQYPGTKIAELYNWNSMRKEERTRVQKEKQRMFAEQKRIKEKAHAELNELRKLQKLWYRLDGKFISGETGHQFTREQSNRLLQLTDRAPKNRETIGMMGRGLHVFKDAAGKPITWAKNAKGKLGDAKNKAGQVIQDLLFSGKKGLGMMGSSAKDFLYHYGVGQSDGIDRYERGSQRLLDSGTSKVATSSVQEALEKKERKKSRRGRVLRYLVKKSYKKIRDKFLFPERHSDPLVKGGSIGPMFKVFDSISSLYGKAKGGLKSAGADPLASGKGSMFKLFDFIDKVRGRPDVNRSGSEGIFSRFKNELINLTNEGARRGERVGDSPKGASKAGAPGMGPQIGLVFHNLLESLKNHARPAGESMSNWWKSFSTGSKFGVSKNKSDKGYAPRRSILKKLVSGISGAIPDLKFPNMNAKSIFGKLRDKGFLTRKEAVDLEKQHESPRQSSTQQRRSKKVNRKKSRNQTKKLENQTGYQAPQRDPLKFRMYEKISEWMARRKNEGVRAWDWGSNKTLEGLAYGKQKIKDSFGFASRNKGKLTLGASALSMLGLKSSSSGLGAALASKLGVTGIGTGVSAGVGTGISTGVGTGISTGVGTGISTGVGGITGKGLLGFLSMIDGGMATGLGAAGLGMAWYSRNLYRKGLGIGKQKVLGQSGYSKLMERTVKYRGEKMSMRDAMNKYTDPTKKTWRDHFGRRSDDLKMGDSISKRSPWETTEKNMMQHYRKRQIDLGKERLERQIMTGHKVLPFDPIYSQYKKFIDKKQLEYNQMKKTPEGRAKLAEINRSWQKQELRKERIKRSRIKIRGRAGGFIPNFSKLSRLIEARNAKKRSMGPGELAIRKPAAKTNIANHPGKNPLTEGYVKMYNQGKITEKELFEMVRGQAGMLKGNPQKFQDQMDYVARSVQKAPQYVQKEKINDMRKTAVDAAGGFIPNFTRLGRKFKKFNLNKSIKEGRKRKRKNKKTNESGFVWGADKSFKFQKISKQLHLDKIDDIFQGFFAGGFIPSFSNPLADSYGREKAALRDRGIPSSAIRLERSSKLVDNKLNPGGWAFTNRVDERLGVNQGIDRSMEMGINPKTHGMSDGFVPNFRFAIRRPTLPPFLKKPVPPSPVQIPKRPVKKQGESDKAFELRENAWRSKRDDAQAKYENKQKAYDEKIRKREQILNTSTMGAMFGGSQIAQAISAGDSAQDKLRGGVGRAMAENAAMGASYGALAGGKGMAAGAIIGGAYGAFDSMANEDRNIRAVKLGEELKAQKVKLDKELNDINGIKGYTAGVQGLNEALSEGDPSKVKDFQKQMIDSMSSITDSKLIDSLSEVGNGTLNFADKVDALTGIMQDAEKQALKTKSAMEVGAAIATAEEQGAGAATEFGNDVKDFLSNNAITEGFNNIWKGITLQGVQQQSVTNTEGFAGAIFDTVIGSSMSRNGGLSSNLRQGVFTEERAKDFAVKNSELFKQSSRISTEDLVRKSFNRQKDIDPNFKTSFKDYKDQNFDAFSVIASQDTADSMDRQIDELESMRLRLLKITSARKDGKSLVSESDIRNIKTFKDLEEFNEKKLDREASGVNSGIKHAINMGNANDYEMEMFKKDMRGQEWYKTLVESGNAQSAEARLDKMTDGGDYGSSESGLSNFSLYEELIDQMKKDRDTQDKLTDALVQNSDATKLNTQRQGDVYDEVKSLITQVRDMTRASEDFKLNNDLAESVNEIRQDTGASAMKARTGILNSVGALTNREAILRTQSIKASNVAFNSDRDLRSKLLGTLMSNFDPGSIVDMPSILKRHNLPEEKKSGGYIKRAQDKLEKDERQDREYFTRSFLEFMSQNADGNTTLTEIRDFTNQLNGTSGYIARIQEQTNAHQARSNILLREQNKQLSSETRQELLKLDADFVNKLGSRLMSNDDTRGIWSAINTGGLLRDGERSKFVKSRKPGSVTDKESDALNSISQLSLEEKLGISLSGVTGRSGLDARENIIERNIEKLEKDLGSDGDQIVKRMRTRKEIAFANLRSAESLNDQKLGDLGYSSDLSDQGKMVAANVTTADQITKFYGLANGQGINISASSINAIGSSFLNGLGTGSSGGDSNPLTGSITGAHKNMVDADFKRDQEEEAKKKKDIVKLKEIKQGSATLRELSKPLEEARARNKATQSLTYGKKSLIDWGWGDDWADPGQLELLKERLKETTLRYDKHEDFDLDYEWRRDKDNRYIRGKKQKDGTTKWDWNNPATEERPLWTPTKEEGGVLFGEDTLQQAFTAWKAKTSPDSNKIDSGLALAKWRIKFPKNIKNPKIIGGASEDFAKNKKIIDEEGRKTNIFKKLQTKEGREDPMVKKFLYGLARDNAIDSTVRSNEFFGHGSDRNFAIAEVERNPQYIENELQRILHSLDPESEYKSRRTEGEDGKTVLKKHEGAPKIKDKHKDEAAGILDDARGNSNLNNILEEFKDEYETAEQIIDEIEQVRYETLLLEERARKLKEEGKTITYTKASALIMPPPAAPQTLTASNELTSLPDSDPFDQGMYEPQQDLGPNRIENNQSAAIDSSNLVSSINELPKRLSDEMNSLVFNHVINGNVTLDFNTEMFSQALGPVMFENLKKMLADPMITSVMARALEGQLKLGPGNFNA